MFPKRDEFGYILLLNTIKMSHNGSPNVPLALALKCQVQGHWFFETCQNE